MKYRELPQENRNKEYLDANGLDTCARCREVIKKEDVMMRTIRVNRQNIAMGFCSGKCGGEEQMACEG